MALSFQSTETMMCVNVIRGLATATRKHKEAFARVSRDLKVSPVNYVGVIKW